MASLLRAKMWPFAMSAFIAFHLVFSQTANGLNGSPGLLFQRVPAYDDVKVTTNANSLDLTTLTSTRCAVSCGHHAWCTSFFFTKGSGLCSLHATVFWGGAGYATASPGTRYYTNVEDWCRLNLERMYSRPAKMCVFFEMDPDKEVNTWTDADSACVNMGMRLASNLTPVKMDALVKMTQKNPKITGAIYIGLKRRAPQSPVLEWLDGQPLDTAAMAPYWEVDQPNGRVSGQDCVVIRAQHDSTLNDVTCGTLRPFVCQLLQP